MEVPNEVSAMKPIRKRLWTVALAAGLLAGSASGTLSPLFELDTRGTTGTYSVVFALDTRDPDVGTGSGVFTLDTRGDLLPVTGVFTLDTRGLDLAYAPERLRLEPEQLTVVRASWEYVGTPLGFVVERRRPLGDWMSTTVSGGSICSWADATVQPGLFYEYRVAAVLSNGVSERSEAAYIQMPSLPLEPDSLGASLAAGGGVALSWQDRSHNEAGFEVWRTAGAAGVWESIAQTVADATGHLDPAVAPATLYTYKVRAFNSWGNSGFSGESGLVTPPPAEGCGFELIVEDAAIRLDGVEASVGGTHPADRRALLAGSVSAWIRSPPGNPHPVRVVFGFRDSTGRAVGSPAELKDFYRIPGCPGLSVAATVPEAFRAPESGTNTLWLEMIMAQRDPVAAFVTERHTQESPMRKRVLHAAIRSAPPMDRVRILEAAIAQGGQVDVPVYRISAGGETAMDFSVSVGSGLRWLGAELGADAPQAWLQVDEGSNSAAGLSLRIPAENPLAAGSVHLATLRFQADLAGEHAVGFQDAPLARAIDGDPAAAAGFAWEDGQVVVSATGLEGDIYPWPCGDGVVDDRDAHLAMLIVLGAVELPMDAAAFQRLDCAPIDTCGDGIIDMADQVAILRYASGQEPPQAACGPVMPSADARITGPLPLSPGSRALWLDAPVEVPRGSSFWVPLVLDANGDEHALSASLTFDPDVLAYQGMGLLGPATNGVFLPNLEMAAQGTMAIGLVLADGQTYAAGAHAVAEILFTALEGEGTVDAALAFAQVPAECRITGLDAAPLASGYFGALVTVRDEVAASAAPPPESGVAVALSMNQIQVSWSPVPWSTGYRIRRRLAGEAVWSRLADFDGTRTVFVDAGLPPGTECHYLVTSLNPNGEESAALRLSARTWTGLEDWRWQWLGQIENTGLAADNEDPDGDGLPNRLEYELGTDPLVADALPFIWAVEELFPGTRSITVSYAIRDGAPGGVTFEFTENLLAPGSWRSHGLAPVSFRREGSADLVKVRLPTDAAEQRILFLRMKAD